MTSQHRICWIRRKHTQVPVQPRKLGCHSIHWTRHTVHAWCARQNPSTQPCGGAPFIILMKLQIENPNDSHVGSEFKEKDYCVNSKLYASSWRNTSIDIKQHKPLFTATGRHKNPFNAKEIMLYWRNTWTKLDYNFVMTCRTPAIIIVGIMRYFRHASIKSMPVRSDLWPDPVDCVCRWPLYIRASYSKSTTRQHF